MIPRAVVGMQRVLSNFSFVVCAQREAQYALVCSISVIRIKNLFNSLW